jgi:hypothetical protein
MATSLSASAAVCLAELELAAAEAAWRKQAVDRAKPLLTEWLRLEGASRMHAELEAQERERLRSLLLAQRAQAYRRVGETPVAERVAYKRAVRELAAAAAAPLIISQAAAAAAAASSRARSILLTSAAYAGSASGAMTSAASAIAGGSCATGGRSCGACA